MNEKFRHLRESRGLSQIGVANYLGISRQMYIKYENGDVEPPIRIIKMLCDLYEVSFDEILSNSHSDVKYKIKPVKDVVLELQDSSVDRAVDLNSFSTNQYLSIILSLVPKLIYSEKAKLLTTLAQSMSSDVEAGKLAGIKPKNQAKQIKNSEEERKASWNSFLALSDSLHINSTGITWTKEELHER